MATVSSASATHSTNESKQLADILKTIETFDRSFEAAAAPVVAKGLEIISGGFGGGGPTYSINAGPLLLEGQNVLFRSLGAMLDPKTGVSVHSRHTLKLLDYVKQVCGKDRVNMQGKPYNVTVALQAATSLLGRQRLAQTTLPLTMCPHPVKSNDLCARLAAIKFVPCLSPTTQTSTGSQFIAAPITSVAIFGEEPFLFLLKGLEGKDYRIRSACLKALYDGCVYYNLAFSLSQSNRLLELLPRLVDDVVCTSVEAVDDCGKVLGLALGAILQSRMLAAVGAAATAIAAQQQNIPAPQQQNGSSAASGGAASRSSPPPAAGGASNPAGANAPAFVYSKPQLLATVLQPIIAFFKSHFTAAMTRRRQSLLSTALGGMLAYPTKRAPLAGSIPPGAAVAAAIPPPAPTAAAIAVDVFAAQNGGSGHAYSFGMGLNDGSHNNFNLKNGLFSALAMEGIAAYLIEALLLPEKMAAVLMASSVGSTTPNASTITNNNGSITFSPAGSITSASIAAAAATIVVDDKAYGPRLLSKGLHLWASQAFESEEDWLMMSNLLLRKLNSLKQHQQQSSPSSSPSASAHHTTTIPSPPTTILARRNVALAALHTLGALSAHNLWTISSLEKLGGAAADLFLVVMVMNPNSNNGNPANGGGMGDSATTAATSLPPAVQKAVTSSLTAIHTAASEVLGQLCQTPLVGEHSREGLVAFASDCFVANATQPLLWALRALSASSSSVATHNTSNSDQTSYNPYSPNTHSSSTPNNCSSYSPKETALYMDVLALPTSPCSDKRIELFHLAATALLGAELSRGDEQHEDGNSVNVGGGGAASPTNRSPTATTLTEVVKRFIVPNTLAHLTYMNQKAAQSASVGGSASSTTKTVTAAAWKAVAMLTRTIVLVGLLDDERRKVERRRRNHQRQGSSHYQQQQITVYSPPTFDPTMVSHLMLWAVTANVISATTFKGIVSVAELANLLARQLAEASPNSVAYNNRSQQQSITNGSTTSYDEISISQRIAREDAAALQQQQQQNDFQNASTSSGGNFASPAQMGGGGRRVVSPQNQHDDSASNASVVTEFAIRAAQRLIDVFLFASREQIPCAIGRGGGGGGGRGGGVNMMVGVGDSAFLSSHETFSDNHDHHEWATLLGVPYTTAILKPYSAIVPSSLAQQAYAGTLRRASVVFASLTANPLISTQIEATGTDLPTAFLAAIGGGGNDSGHNNNNNHGGGIAGTPISTVSGDGGTNSPSSAGGNHNGNSNFIVDDIHAFNLLVFGWDKLQSGFGNNTASSSPSLVMKWAEAIRRASAKSISVPVRLLAERCLRLLAGSRTNLTNGGMLVPICTASANAPITPIVTVSPTGVVSITTSTTNGGTSAVTSPVSNGTANGGGMLFAAEIEIIAYFSALCLQQPIAPSSSSVSGGGGITASSSVLHLPSVIDPEVAIEACGRLLKAFVDSPVATTVAHHGLRAICHLVEMYASTMDEFELEYIAAGGGGGDTINNNNRAGEGNQTPSAGSGGNNGGNAAPITSPFQRWHTAFVTHVIPAVWPLRFDPLVTLLLTDVAVLVNGSGGIFSNTNTNNALNSRAGSTAVAPPPPMSNQIGGSSSAAAVGSFTPEAKLFVHLVIHNVESSLFPRFLPSALVDAIVVPTLMDDISDGTIRIGGGGDDDEDDEDNENGDGNAASGLNNGNGKSNVLLVSGDKVLEVARSLLAKFGGGGGNGAGSHPAHQHRYNNAPSPVAGRLLLSLLLTNAWSMATLSAPATNINFGGGGGGGGSNHTNGGNSNSSGTDLLEVLQEVIIPAATMCARASLPHSLQDLKGYIVQQRGGGGGGGIRSVPGGVSGTNMVPSVAPTISKLVVMSVLLALFTEEMEQISSYSSSVAGVGMGVGGGSSSPSPAAGDFFGGGGDDALQKQLDDQQKQKKQLLIDMWDTLVSGLQFSDTHPLMGALAVDVLTGMFERAEGFFKKTSTNHNNQSNNSAPSNIHTFSTKLRDLFVPLKSLCDSPPANTTRFCELLSTVGNIVVMTNKRGGGGGKGKQSVSTAVPAPSLAFPGATMQFYKPPSNLGNNASAAPTPAAAVASPAEEAHAQSAFTAVPLDTLKRLMAAAVGTIKATTTAAGQSSATNAISNGGDEEEDALLADTAATASPAEEAALTLLVRCINNLFAQQQQTQNADDQQQQQHSAAAHRAITDFISAQHLDISTALSPTSAMTTPQQQQGQLFGALDRLLSRAVSNAAASHGSSAPSSSADAVAVSNNLYCPYEPSTVYCAKANGAHHHQQQALTPAEVLTFFDALLPHMMHSFAVIISSRGGSSDAPITQCRKIRRTQMLSALVVSSLAATSPGVPTNTHTNVLVAIGKATNVMEALIPSLMSHNNNGEQLYSNHRIVVGKLLVGKIGAGDKNNQSLAVTAIRNLCALTGFAPNATGVSGKKDTTNTSASSSPYTTAAGWAGPLLLTLLKSFEVGNNGMVDNNSLIAPADVPYIVRAITIVGMMSPQQSSSSSAPNPLSTAIALGCRASVIAKHLPPKALPALAAAITDEAAELQKQLLEAVGADSDNTVDGRGAVIGVTRPPTPMPCYGGPINFGPAVTATFASSIPAASLPSLVWLCGWMGSSIAAAGTNKKEENPSTSSDTTTTATISSSDVFITNLAQWIVGNCNSSSGTSSSSSPTNVLALAATSPFALGVVLQALLLVDELTATTTSSGNGSTSSSSTQQQLQSVVIPRLLTIISSYTTSAQSSCCLLPQLMLLTVALGSQKVYNQSSSAASSDTNSHQQYHTPFFYTIAPQLGALLQQGAKQYTDVFRAVLKQLGGGGGSGDLLRSVMMGTIVAPPQQQQSASSSLQPIAGNNSATSSTMPSTSAAGAGGTTLPLRGLGAAMMSGSYNGGSGGTTTTSTSSTTAAAPGRLKINLGAFK